MLLQSPQNWKDYELIDSGNFEKLERFGQFVLARPEPKALWDKSLSAGEWDRMAHTRFVTGAGFGKSGKEDSGTWKMLKKMPDQWYIKYGAKDLDFKLRLGLTSFKHVGVFPEQAPNWNFIHSQSSRLVKKFKESGKQELPKVLNLFAYTGAASLAARCAGADTTHLDSVRQVVTWAKGNMESSGLDNIRWVVEDALKFVKREVKRGKQYNGLILDPPAYGHGPDGEKWKLDELLFELLQNCAKIVAPEDAFMVLNLYSNGYSALLADTAVRTAFGFKEVKVMDDPLGPKSVAPGETHLGFGELVLRDKFGKAIPLSVFSRLVR
ncbi:MAG: class I SAM-dependent methyltransferase [Bacteroidales bacterium]|nr:class I SAM-dependent methyltransferase [Bacteroidales bacterium]